MNYQFAEGLLRDAGFTPKKLKNGNGLQVHVPLFDARWAQEPHAYRVLDLTSIHSVYGFCQRHLGYDVVKPNIEAFHEAALAEGYDFASLSTPTIDKFRQFTNGERCYVSSAIFSDFDGDIPSTEFSFAMPNSNAIVGLPQLAFVMLDEHSLARITEIQSLILDNRLDAVKNHFDGWKHGGADIQLSNGYLMIAESSVDFVCHRRNDGAACQLKLEKPIAPEWGYVLAAICDANMSPDLERSLINAACTGLEYDQDEVLGL